MVNSDKALLEAYERDIRRALRARDSWLDQIPELKGMSPENVIDYLAFLYLHQLQGMRRGRYNRLTGIRTFRRIKTRPSLKRRTHGPI